MRTELKAREGLTCSNCGQLLPPRRTRYCRECGPLASKLWKRLNRRECAGTHYWLDAYLKRHLSLQAAQAAYREDCRQRVARWRSRLRTDAIKAFFSNQTTV